MLFLVGLGRGTSSARLSDLSMVKSGQGRGGSDM